MHVQYTSSLGGDTVMYMFLFIIVVPLRLRGPVLGDYNVKSPTKTKVIDSLAYACSDVHHLEEMGKLDDLVGVFKSGLPSSEELILRPLSLVERMRRICGKYRKLSKSASAYSSLESYSHSQPGRKRADFRYRNRVGIKADRLRKVNLLHM